MSAAAKELFEAACAAEATKSGWDGGEFSTNPHEGAAPQLPAFRAAPGALAICLDELEGSTYGAPFRVAILALHGMRLEPSQRLGAGLERAVVELELPEDFLVRLRAVELLWELHPERARRLGLHRSKDWMDHIGKSIGDAAARAAFFRDLFADPDPNVAALALRCAYLYAFDADGGDARRHVPREVVEALSKHDSRIVRKSAEDYLASFTSPYNRPLCFAQSRRIS
ncbi:MAG: hypothetical protein KIT84_41580 [Labilithrix sp.]|nr:hypothetical protein [Labilithrix sp.]MCW5817564.1 hypothetical protein [Labilithrix sp.]